jgi:methylmalonyl-CoA carboxyltransferase small subunit
MKLKISIDGRTYEVDVEVAAHEPVAAALPSYLLQPAAVRVPAAPAGAAVAPLPDEGPVDEDKVCRSPISGIVVRVPSQAGQKMQPGDVLLVLEAMKMETNITAPVAGKIARLRVGTGDPVKAGQIVVEFE